MIDTFLIPIHSCVYIPPEYLTDGVDATCFRKAHFHYTTHRGIEFDSQTLFTPGSMVRVTIEEVPDEWADPA